MFFPKPVGAVMDYLSWSVTPLSEGKMVMND
jgi:hypothetical protein